MSVALIAAAITLFAVSGLPGLLLSPRSPWIGRLHTVIALLGASLGFIGAVGSIIAPDSGAYLLPWPSAPGAWIGVDALSAYFLLPLFLIGGLGAVYGLAYWPMRSYLRTAARLRFFWGLALAGMGLLLISKHALSFLLGWETMALAAFFLVSTEDEKGECRRSGLIYLMATHLGTLVLLGFFALWRSASGSFDLLPLSNGQIPAATVNILFLLALFGFGLKAGLMPLHFWLPGAHANAPSHVSALMSGVLIKMGIYGIVRVAALLPDISLFWGWFILFLGAVSGLLGVAFALAQHDLKKLLAYHSVENIGIIVMGLGLALLGRSHQRPEWIVLGMAGCLLHVWNHGLFKALLFFGAGSVLHGAKTRQIDRLGGLARRMPWTAAAFLLGAVAISGLPPLNGFISEFFIYLGFFTSAQAMENQFALVLFGAPVLAMIGALAVACFVKVYGAVFLGCPRSDAAGNAHESSLSMRLPMVVLGILCLGIGIFPALVLPLLGPAISVWQGRGVLVSSAASTLDALVPFGWLSAMTGILMGLILMVGLLLFFKQRRMPASSGLTWDCGYGRPTARMQYTAASLARTLVNLGRWVLRPHQHDPQISSSFPQASCLHSHVDDPILDRVLIPDFERLRRLTRWFTRFQQGQAQYYILYLVVTLGILLATMIPFRRLFYELFSK